MTRIAIVTDSTASLPQELVERYHIHVIPNKVTFGSQVYQDGVDITPAEFYRMLETAPTSPTISAPMAGWITEYYGDLMHHADEIVSIHASGLLSNAVGYARSAKGTLNSPHIHVIDSQSASMGLGLVVLAAARAAEEGEDVNVVVAAAEKLVPKINIILVAETLKYLAGTMHFSKAAMAVGSVLQIKPVLCIESGRVEVLEKVRSTTKARGQMIKAMEEKVGSGATVHAAVVHANSLAEAEAMREELAKRFDRAELCVAELGPVIGMRTGPGAVGIAFYAEK